MRITILGANGKVGRLAVQEALRRGHTVVAFVRSSEPETHEHLEVVKGDIYNAEDLRRAVIGSDVVISALGSWGTPRKDVLATAMRNLIPILEADGPQRIISLTGNVARAPHERMPPMAKLARLGLKLFAGKILADGERHIALLTASTLDWTVVRSPVMDDSDGAYKLHERAGLMGTIGRKAVAESLVTLAEDDVWVKQTPLITR